MKKQELTKFLGCEAQEITETEYGTYDFGREEYLVLTDAEAEVEVKKRILDDIWAFRAAWLIRHIKGYNKLSQGQEKALVEAIEMLQEKLCEAANPILAAMINNIDNFIADAIDTDGRGHFLASYDGEEVKAGEFFIYRIN